MSVYAGTYTLSREALALLLHETVDEVEYRCLRLRALKGKTALQAQRQALIDASIATMLVALDFDATRPAGSLEEHC